MKKRIRSFLFSPKRVTRAAGLLFLVLGLISTLGFCVFTRNTCIDAINQCKTLFLAFLVEVGKFI